MCDYHGEESLSGGLAKETLLPPGRPAASPPRALSLRGTRPPPSSLPGSGARPNPAAPCRPAPGGAPSPAARAPQPQPLSRRPPHVGRPGLALAPLLSRELRDVTRVRPYAPRVRGSAVWARDVPPSSPWAGALLPPPWWAPQGGCSRLCPESSVGGRKGGVSFLHILENYGNLSRQCFSQTLEKRHVPRAEPLGSVSPSHP